MNQIIKQQNHQIITKKDIPDWVDIGNGDWLQINQLEQSQLPTLQEINEYLEKITTCVNCSPNEALVFASELTKCLKFSKDDNRMESPRFIKLFTQIITNYPFAVVDEVWDDLTKKTWFPELDEIEERLNKLDEPRRIAISRIGTLKLKVSRFKSTAKIIPLTPKQKDQIKAKTRKMK